VLACGSIKRGSFQFSKRKRLGQQVYGLFARRSPVAALQ
jgi:hypothetical protein